MIYDLISMGQLLSLIMILGGFILWTWRAKASRKNNNY
jgi:prolipoprotein diacylglyceryltransferase